MEYSLFVSLLVLLFLPSICPSDNSTDSNSSWAKLQISPDSLCSMPYGSFRVNIYEHAYNQKSTTLPTRRKYYYAPIALLDHKSAVSDFNNVTNQAEMRFRIEMWNDQVENEVVNYLEKIVNEKVELHQVQVIPLEKVILASTVPSTAYSLSCNWLPYNLHKSLWFTISCFVAKDCEQLAANMRHSPQQFEHFKLLFSLTSQTSQRKETAIRIDNVVSGQMVTKLMQRYGRQNKEVFLTANDEKKLLSESTSKILVETFDDSDVVSSNSELEIYNILKDLLISSRTTIKEQRDKMWDSVFWNNENYRPDKASKTINELFKKKNNDDQKKLINLYQKSDKLVTSGETSGSQFAELAKAEAGSTRRDSASKDSSNKEASESQTNDKSFTESESASNASSLITSVSASGSGYGVKIKASGSYENSEQDAGSKEKSGANKDSADFMKKEIEEKERSNHESGSNENLTMDKSGSSFTDRHSTESGLSRLASTTREELVKFYDETKDHIEWNGEQFIPKPMSLGRVNLAQLHDKQTFQDHKVKVRYSTAVLSTPINFAQHADLSLINEWQILKDTVANLTKELHGSIHIKLK